MQTVLVKYFKKDKDNVFYVIGAVPYTSEDLQGAFLR